MSALLADASLPARVVMVLAISAYIVMLLTFLVWAWLNRPKVDPKWRP